MKKWEVNIQFKDINILVDADTEGEAIDRAQAKLMFSLVNGNGFHKLSWAEVEESLICIAEHHDLRNGQKYD